MSPLTTDNRNLVEIEMELRARIEAQRAAIEEVRTENFRLRTENEWLRETLEGSHRLPARMHDEMRLIHAV